MSPVFDPTVRLALALNSSRGAYAALLGSGISAAAGIPTGRQIVADLIAKVAALEGASIGEDPFGWYRGRFGEEPDYSKLLDELASSPTERSELLRRYFEPTPEQRRQGLRVPGAAHRALARLAASGYISVFLTTNFDRLLEQALESAGVAPTTVSTPDALEGTAPLGRTRCTVVKLNGDYLDTRIKNTPEELDAYHPAIDKLLDRVFDEYGLIVCGWSADWDTALRRAIERCPTHRYTTFWASRNPPVGLAAKVIELRGAEIVRIKDADTLFTDLAAKLAALDRGTGASPEAVSLAVAGLPARVAAFVGRRAELADVKRHLEEPSRRLLTLLGPGGTGKTTLAIRAAEEVSPAFPDGVAFVDLSSARTTEAVLVSIVRAIGVGEAADRSPKDALTNYLRQRRALLVLDNFEQVTEAADLVSQLLADCPKLSMLVTSREALHLRAEHIYPVPPLTLPEPDLRHPSAAQVQACEAAQLFIDRAQAVRPEFQLTDANASAVAEICRRLDGLPLAIELAAARLRLFSPEALQEQLRDRLKLLRSGPRDLPERQQTLRATVDWSYDLLKPEEQRLFDLLAVFVSADIAAVEAVAAGVDPTDGVATDVLDGLTSLIEKSLIRRVDLPPGEPRIAMLETIREFAAYRLAQRPDFASRARRAHADYYADLARRLQPELIGARRIAALAAMAAEIDNLKLAWGYWVAAGDLGQLEKLADGLLILNEARGWYRDTVDLTTDMLAVLANTVSSPSRTGQEIALRTSLARALMATKGYTPEVEEATARSLDLFEHGTNVRQQFSALRALANLYNLRGDVQKAAQIGLEILDFAERERNPSMLIEGHLLVGTSRMFIDDLKGGLEHFDRAIALFPSVPAHAFVSRAGGNDPRVPCYTSSAIGLWLLGYPERAVVRVNAALSLAAEVDHPFTTAFARFHAGLLHLWRRDFDTVLDRVGGLLEVADEHGFKIWTAAGTVLLGAAQTGLGRADEGLANLHSGIDLYQGLRSPPVFWPMLQAIKATACHAAGRSADGLAPIEAAIEIMSPGDGATLLPEFHLVKGDLLLALATENGTDDAEAQHWYRLAYEGARQRKVRISELRAATRLCRIANANDRVAAQDALREIYTSFTEGSATADLIEARAVLADLAPA